MLQTPLKFDYLPALLTENSLTFRVGDCSMNALEYKEKLKFLNMDLILGILYSRFQMISM